MTFAEIQQEIAERLNLTSATALARIGRSINERYRLVASTLGLQTTARSTATASTVIGNRSVTFGPAPRVEKLYMVYDASVTPPRLLDSLLFDELRLHSIGTDPPRAYAIQRMGADTVTILLNCVPTSVYSLTADVLANVAVLAGGAQPAFAESFHDLLIHGGLSTELEKLEKYDLAKTQQLHYEQRLSDLRFFIAKNAFTGFYQGKAGVGSVSVGGGGGGSGVVPVPAYLAWAFNVRDFGAAGNGITDDTAAFNACYAAAKAESKPMWIPPGIYVFTSTLVWDGYVTVIGAGRGNSTLGTILKKKGNFVGIQIGNGFGTHLGGETVYQDFVVDSFDAGVLDFSTGIEVNTGGTHGLVLRSVTVRNQGNHGLNISSAAMDLFENLSLINNRGVGLNIAPALDLYVNANTFINIDIRQSGSQGLWIRDGGQGAYSNQIMGLVCHANVGYGLRVDTPTNYIVAYVEANLGGDVYLAFTAIRNYIALLNSSQTNPAVIDNGSNNMVLDFSTGRWGMPDGISRPIPGTNIAGRDFSIQGGNAGPGAVGHPGGFLAINGGSAVGTTGAAAGGIVSIDGGAGVNLGAKGRVQIQTNSGAGIAINGAVDPGVSVAMDFQSTTRVPQLPRLTTAQRDALVALNGMIIYNTTSNKVQVVENGNWLSVV